MPGEESTRKIDPKDHLANERTFLAWVRTSIGIMAFGFVIEKFSLFVKQISLFLQGEKIPFSAHQEYSPYLGAILVSIGVVIAIFAFFKYKTTQKQIEKQCYRPTALLDILLMLCVVFIGFFLIFYLDDVLSLT